MKYIIDLERYNGQLMKASQFNTLFFDGYGLERLTKLTDEVCIEHLQKSGWMPKHDKAMCEQGNIIGKQRNEEEYNRGLKDAWEAARKIAAPKSAAAWGELVTALRKRAVELPEKFSKNAENIDLFLKAVDAIKELSRDLDSMNDANIALYGALPKWIPVTKRLPSIGKDVLCFCRANICFVLGWDGYHWHEGADRYYMSSFVTHWMPLPEPPKEKT